MALFIYQIGHVEKPWQYIMLVKTGRNSIFTHWQNINGTTLLGSILVKSKLEMHLPFDTAISHAYVHIFIHICMLIIFIQLYSDIFIQTFSAVWLSVAIDWIQNSLTYNRIQDFCVALENEGQSTQLARWRTPCRI